MKSMRKLNKVGMILSMVIGMIIAACMSPAAGPEVVESDEAAAPAMQEVQSTLSIVQERGKLVCIGNSQLPGFGFLDSEGNFTGFDVDYCRAIAAAIFGDANALEVRPATARERFTILSSGEGDVIIRNTTWTMSRDTDLGMNFGPTTFYDGAGIMVKADRGLMSVTELNGATICILDGTSTQGAVSDFFAEQGLTYSELTFQANPELRGAFIGDQCDAWSSDKSQLGGHQFTLKADDGIDAVVLPETLSKEPLGPSVRDYDSEWEDVVRWVVNGMIIAEEQGVTSSNVSQMASNPPNNTVARLLGVGFDGGNPSDLGIGHGKIPVSFMQSVISQVGNYGEVYGATLERVGLVRDGSLNASYINGGLIYSPPMR